MQFTLPSWLTVIFTGVASAVPMFLSFIPAPYNAVAAGVVALVGSIYHLYRPSPAAPPPPLLPLARK